MRGGRREENERDKGEENSLWNCNYGNKLIPL